MTFIPKKKKATEFVKKATTVAVLRVINNQGYKIGVGIKAIFGPREFAPKKGL